MRLARWFLSPVVREAHAMRAGARRLLREQQDLLAPDSIATVEAATRALHAALRRDEGAAELTARMNALQEAADAHLIAVPHAARRENILEVHTVCVKIFAVFCFFLQPMAIPSGSAQPTLYGITHVNGRGDPAFEIPGWFTRALSAMWFGVRHYHVVAQEDGPIEEIREPKLVLPFVKRQSIRQGGRWHHVWFPPDNLAERARIREGERFEAGEDLVRLRVTSGDHLLVNRLTYNFRRPRRGEMIVFASTGVAGLIQNTHYIKRLVAFGGERVRLGDDRHVVIDGVRLDASTPGFENVYFFSGPPRDGAYSGHVNNRVARAYGRPNIAPLFPDGASEYEVPSGHFLAFGDNTMNSHDSRAWGEVPDQKIVGKAAFVFWPISPRFGWGFR